MYGLNNFFEFNDSDAEQHLASTCWDGYEFNSLQEEKYCRNHESALTIISNPLVKVKFGRVKRSYIIRRNLCSRVVLS